ncbi:MAG: hypothetical protein FJ004_11960, partial [Chloroflexi bacterium]|nr:hypothetical protein [Chloroflexota bacterium]
KLGPEGAAALMSGVKGEVERMKSHDWSEVRNRGLTSQKFLSGVIRRIALMKALADTVGLERASAIQCRLLDRTIYQSMSPMWPTVADYKACGDFFRAFCDYTRVAMNANVRSGLHGLDWIEDSPKALAFDIKYCVWHEVAKALGNPYFCYPSTCYGDEITIPIVLGEAGPEYRWRRTGTLAQGAPVCDFRYEVLR